MLNVKTLALIFPGRSGPMLYKIIKELKAKYQLRYASAEIQITFLVK